MSQLTILLQLLLAAILGAVIGLERKRMAEQAAGTKTYALVSLGSTLFTLLSAFGFGSINTDPTRIAAQIVTGIGFLGAGMIIVHRGEIRGLTTAAGLWVAAALGMAVAVGWYLIAVVTAVAIATVLFYANKMKDEEKKEKP